MDQEHDFPPETSDHSGSECEEEESVIDSEEENCSATDLIDALADIPKQSKFQDLTPNDKLPNDFLLQSFQKVSLILFSFKRGRYFLLYLMMLLFCFRFQTQKVLIKL